MGRMPHTVVAVDVETTGFHSHDRIVTLGAWRVKTAHLDGEALPAECIHIVFDPGRKSHPRAEAVHGWSDWVLRHQQPFESFADVVGDFLSGGEIVVAHNAGFDLEFIDREYRRLGRTGPILRPYCTMNGCRESGSFTRASLAAICRDIGLVRAGTTHGALEDAWLALMVYFWLHRADRRHIRSFAAIPADGLPIVPTNFKEPPPIPDGPLPRRRAATAAQAARVLRTAQKEAKEALLRAIRPTAILLMEVGRASEALAREEIDILVSLLRATRDRLGLEVGDAAEQDILAELFDLELSQNLLTRAARGICEDETARLEFPRWLATMATIDGDVSEAERAAIDRVKAAIGRALGT